MRIEILAAACAALAACGPGKMPETSATATAAATAATAALGAPASVAASASRGDPAAVIEPLYAPYLKEGQNPPDWRSAVPWSAATRDLIEKEAVATAKTGEVGAIDGDVVIAAQDWKVSSVKVTLKSPPADGRAVVEAAFDNLGQSTIVDWDMVVENGAWKVENVHEPEVDLVKLLQASVKR